jgi:hypothetical protein
MIKEMLKCNTVAEESNTIDARPTAFAFTCVRRLKKSD